MNNCPFCDAPLIDGEFYRFECGTKHIDGMEKSQLHCNERSKICYEREIQQLKYKLSEYDCVRELYWKQPDYDECFED